MRLAYVILVPDDVHNFMRRVGFALYERYAATLRPLVLPPHVTLKQPFEAHDVEPFETYLDDLAAELEPWELVMRGFGVFQHDGVVFVDVEQDRRLPLLQRRIIDDLGLRPGMFESGEPELYHFHGTVAIGLTPAQLRGAQSMLGDPPEFRFPVKRLGLFRYTREFGTPYRVASLRGTET